ncbi:MAG TPA: ABC transporter permease [Polyangiaceae bacterium]|nr:ABC transporter permease [Polyangiaceae bacterium]
MRALDVFASAGAAFAHRSRAALTLLGIAIGSGSIVLLAGVLRGGEDALVRANQGVTGADIVQVRRKDASEAERSRATRELTRADAAALAASERLSGATVSAEGRTHTEAHFGRKKKEVSVVSASPETPATYRLALAKGRFLDADDARSGRRVCVVGHEVYRELLGSPASLEGLRVTVESTSFEVVGALADKPHIGATTGTWIWNRKIMVPEPVYDATFAPDHTIGRVYLRPAPGGPPESLLRGAVRALIKRRHHGVENFELVDPSERAQEQMVLSVIKALVFAVGPLALVASGINILNVMLAIVAERTREIGLRRAIGASPRAVVTQFLIEAAALSTLGGLAGIAGGAGVLALASFGLSKVFGTWNYFFEPWAAALGLGLALVTGVTFGVAPALRAAQIDPVGALRDELGRGAVAAGGGP